ncbi:MAG: beta-glucosidase BglX [Clostridiales bacterium]
MNKENKQLRFVKTKYEDKINDIINKMTIDEKIGQLNQVGTSIYGSEEKFYKDLIREGKVGSFLSLDGVKKINMLQKISLEESRLKIPLLFANDIIHGYRTIFPIPLAESCSWDEELARKTARASAMESWAAGINWTFAPMVDIARDPRWGRISEGFGEDTYLSGILAKAKVDGYQGEDLSKNGNILACAKHFTAYGGAEGGRDYNTVDMSRQQLHEVYIPPFKEAIKAGVGTLMAAFNDLNGVPCTANKYLLKDVLKDKLGFEGVIISDYNAIAELITHGHSKDLSCGTNAAFNSGIDVDMCSFGYLKNLKELIDEGSISIDDLNESVRNVLRLKFMLGLFDNPYKSDEKLENEYVMKKEYLELSRESAQKSIVLLKNSEKILPLDKNLKKISLIGPLADNKEDLLGSWATTGNKERVVTVLEGLNKAVCDKTDIMYSIGCEIEGEDEKYFNEAIEMAKKSDAIIAVLGESALMSGEAHCRSNIDLPGVQEKLLKKLNEIGKPIVLVLMNGRPISIPWADKNISAIIEAWHLGTEAGNAICDVLFGNVNPSGKLTTTFPHTSGQIPVYYNHTNTGRPPEKSKSIYEYDSKYIDSPITPLYPFGYGLSYTNYEYSNLEIYPKQISKNGEIDVRIDVKNLGDREGDEIVQLYIQDLFASRVRPVKELKDFRKVKLQPGEVKIVTFKLNISNLGFYNENMEYVVESGDFKVFVGTNSEEVLEDGFEVI